MLIDLLHFLHKDLPVFSHLDGGHRRSQNPHLVLLQDAQLGQLHAAVQSRLTAERQQDPIWALVFYYLSKQEDTQEHQVCNKFMI